MTKDPNTMLKLNIKGLEALLGFCSNVFYCVAPPCRNDVKMASSFGKKIELKD